MSNPCLRSGDIEICISLGCHIATLSQSVYTRFEILGVTIALFRGFGGFLKTDVYSFTQDINPCVPTKRGALVWLLVAPVTNDLALLATQIAITSISQASSITVHRHCR